MRLGSKLVVLSLIVGAVGGSNASAEPLVPFPESELYEPLLYTPLTPPPETYGVPSALAIPSATETVDQIFLDTVENVCSDSSYDAACLQLLESYAKSYSVALSLESSEMSNLSGDDEKVENLRPALESFVDYINAGLPGSEDGLKKGIKTLIEIAVDGTKSAEDLIISLSKRDGGKKPVNVALKAVLKELKAELAKETDADDKKVLEARIKKTEDLIAKLK